MTSARARLVVLVEIEDGLGVATHDLLSRLERICLASQLLPKDTKSEAVHLKLTVIDITEELLLFRYQRLGWLDLTECRVFMLENDGHETRLQGGRGQAIETFIAPESCCCGECIAENHFHTGIETASQQRDLCSSSDRAFCRYQLVDDGWQPVSCIRQRRPHRC